MKLESLKDYLSSNAEFTALANQIYQITAPYCVDYPNYKDWFYHKQLAGLSTAERNILFARDFNQIMAVACLKNNFDKKRQTFYRKIIDKTW